MYSFDMICTKEDCTFYTEERDNKCKFYLRTNIQQCPHNKYLIKPENNE